MNTRQFNLIKILLSSEERYLVVDELASQVGCSEKTVRNDLKYIADLFAKHSDIQLNRKPGFGIFLLGSDEERKKLLHLFMAKRGKTDEERIFELTYDLLLAEHPLTLQYFAEKHFTNRAGITKDLENVTDWLAAFKITLQSKQRIGIFLKGNETNKRSAIAHLIASRKNNVQSIAQLFPEHDVNFIQSVLQRHHFSFVDETMERLVIHCLIMVKRIKQGNPMIITKKDEQITKQPEYAQAKQLAKEIEPYFALKIPNSEVVYLAWHLISGKKLTIDKADNPAIKRLVTELISEMATLTGMRFEKDHILQEGLYTHLKPVLNRLTYQLPIKNPLLSEIKKMYPYMFSTVITALKKSPELFSMILLEDEVAYIVLHFQASAVRMKKNINKKIRAIIVCHLGIGISQLLTSRIEQQMDHLQIISCVSKADLHHHLDDGLDVIISTVELPDLPIQQIVISPLFDKEDQERLASFIKTNGMPAVNEQNYSTLRDFLQEDSIFLQVDLEHRFDIVEMLANSLYARGFVKKQFVEDAISREKTSATSIGSSIAIPHGNPASIIRSGIAVAALKHPIVWGNEDVSLVFLLAIVDEDTKKVKKLFNELSFLSEQAHLVKKLSTEVNRVAFLNGFIQ